VNTPARSVGRGEVVGAEVFTAVSMKNSEFRDVTPYSPVLISSSVLKGEPSKQPARSKRCFQAQDWFIFSLLLMAPGGTR
jgi:hypothetical protein